MISIEGVIYRVKREGKIGFNAVWTFAKRIFYDNIPSDDIKELPAAYAFPIGSLVYAIILTAFLVLFFIGYLEDISQKFLSATPGAGSCSNVPKTLSGTYLADSNGLWESSPEFEYTKALYSFKFPGYSGSKKVYEDSLQQAFDFVTRLGAKSKSLNLGSNLLYWMAASGAVVSGGSSNVFQMNGSPKVLFDKLVYYASFSAEGGVCPVHPRVIYDSGGSTMRLEFAYSEFTSNAICRSIVTPEHMGYSAKYGLDHFSFSIDSQTLLTALSVSQGILDFEDLELIPHSSIVYQYKGTENIQLGKYFYPRYPAMKPLFCMSLDNGSLLCTIQYFNLYLYPIFNHAGYSPFYPHYCDCADPSVGQSTACNLFNFITGFVFFDYNEALGETEYTAIDRLIDFSAKSPSSPADINKGAFNASFDAATDGDHAYTSLPSWRHDIYSFCRLSDGLNSTCSMLSVLLSQGFTLTGNSSDDIVDSPNKDYTVSDHYYQLLYGSCNDTFTISEESMARLMASPPQALEERYYECTPSKTNAAINAWGIASSNVATLSPIFITVILMMFTAYNNLKKREVAHTYSAGERADALNFLAFSLLLARDGHYDGAVDDVIMKLRAELGATESINRFVGVSGTVPEPSHADETGDVEMKVATDGNNSSCPSDKKALSASRKAPLPTSHFDILPNPMFKDK
jgi:hypothetical protein